MLQFIKNNWKSTLFGGLGTLLIGHDQIEKAFQGGHVDMIKLLGIVTTLLWAYYTKDSNGTSHPGN